MTWQMFTVYAGWYLSYVWVKGPYDLYMPAPYFAQHRGPSAPACAFTEVA